MSTNGRPSFERPQIHRLVVLGYVIALGGVVLFFTAQRSVASGHSVEPFFEPEAVTQAALFRVAFPLLLLMFLLSIGGAATRRDRPVVPDQSGPGHAIDQPNSGVAVHAD